MAKMNGSECYLKRLVLNRVHLARLIWLGRFFLSANLFGKIFHYFLDVLKVGVCVIVFPLYLTHFYPSDRILFSSHFEKGEFLMAFPF